MSVLEVTELLNLVRKSIKTHKYDMVPTAKNRESKRKYGLTQLDIEYFILSLKADNLYKGPEVDRYYPNETLYVFKKEIIKIIAFEDNKINKIKSIFKGIRDFKKNKFGKM